MGKAYTIRAGEGRDEKYPFAEFPDFVKYWMSPVWGIFLELEVPDGNQKQQIIWPARLWQKS